MGRIVRGICANQVYARRDIERLAGVIIGVMQITMDKFGRIIIPKVLRDHLGFEPGCRLDLEESLEGLVLKAAQSNSFLERDRYGHFVYTGQAPAGIDWDRIVEEDRE